MARRSEGARHRENRESMASAITAAAVWITNVLIEAPDSIEVDKEGVISVNYFLDDGPRICSIIEGVGLPPDAKWEANRHGFFLEYDNIKVQIYAENKTLRLHSSELLRAFSPEEE